MSIMLHQLLLINVHIGQFTGHLNTQLQQPKHK